MTRLGWSIAVLFIVACGVYNVMQMGWRAALLSMVVATLGIMGGVWLARRSIR